MIFKAINSYQPFNINYVGQLSFLLGTFFLGSVLPLSIIFYLISILISFRHKTFQIFKNQFNNFLLIISGLMIFSNLNNSLNVNSKDFFEIWISLFNWLPLFFLYSCSKIYLNSIEKRVIFSKFLMAGTIPVLISCILQNWFGVVGPFELFNGLIVWYMDKLDLNDIAISGLFSNRNYAGLWLSATLGLSIYELLNLQGNLYKKIFIIVFNLLTILFTIFTFSRNALLGLLIIFVVVLKKFKFIIPFFSMYIFSNFLILNSSIGSFLELNNLSNLKRFFILNLENILNFNRIEVFSITSRLILEKPIFGWGSSTFAEMYKMSGGIQSTQHSHNIILELAYNYGIPIALLLAGFVSFLLFKTIKTVYFKYTENEKNLINKCWLASSLVVTISHLSDITYYDGKISILIWVLLSGLECIIKEGQINFINNYPFLQKSSLNSP